MKAPRSLLVHAAVVAAVILSAPSRPAAHCDQLDGPVVTAARAALMHHNVDLVLIWIDAGDAPAVREAFADAVAVRQLGQTATRIADRQFFETVVRLHRAAEGAPYTGLKPAGRDPGQAVTAAERAIAADSADAAVQLIVKGAEAGIRERFARVVATKKFAPSDLSAGREHVRAYVEFLHYVEGLYDAAHPKAVHHH